MWTECDSRVISTVEERVIVQLYLCPKLLDVFTDFIIFSRLCCYAVFNVNVVDIFVAIVAVAVAGTLVSVAVVVFIVVVVVVVVGGLFTHRILPTE